MSTYNITKTRKGWVVKKDGERLAGLYQREQFALISLAFGLWRSFENDQFVTEDMVAMAVAKKFNDAEQQP